MSERTVMRRMKEALGPTGAPRVRVDSCVGAMLREDAQGRVDWAEAGDSGRINVRMDAMSVPFPERTSGQLLLISSNLRQVVLE